jgi:hypothetical protein
MGWWWLWAKIYCPVSKQQDCYIKGNLFFANICNKYTFLKIILCALAMICHSLTHSFTDTLSPIHSLTYSLTDAHLVTNPFTCRFTWLQLTSLHFTSLHFTHSLNRTVLFNLVHILCSRLNTGHKHGFKANSRSAIHEISCL